MSWYEANKRGLFCFLAANDDKVNEATSIYLLFIHHYLKSFVSFLLYNSKELHYLCVVSDVSPLPMLFGLRHGHCCRAPSGLFEHLIHIVEHILLDGSKSKLFFVFYLWKHLISFRLPYKYLIIWFSLRRFMCVHHWSMTVYCRTWLCCWTVFKVDTLRERILKLVEATKAL